LEETGILNKIRIDYSPNLERIRRQCERRDTEPLGLQETISAFYLIGLGIILSVLVIAWELTMNRKYDQNKTKTV